MAEISIGDAVGEGVALIRTRPGAVLTWGLVQVAVAGLGFSLLIPFMLSSFGAAMRLGAAAPPPDLQTVMRMQSLSYLIDLVNLFASSVVYCAAFRAVLHPERGRFAYLRVGAPELLLFLLIIAGYVALIVGAAVAAIPIVLLVIALSMARAAAAGAILAVAASVAALVVAVYLALRVSLVGPAMVDDGKFHLVDAWALTRGEVGSLFGLSLVILLIVLAAETVAAIVLMAVGFGVIGSLAGGLGNLPVFLKLPPQTYLPKLAPLLAVMAVVWIPLTGCFLAMVGGPWARAYRDLRPARDISETFA